MKQLRIPISSDITAETYCKVMDAVIDKTDIEEIVLIINSGGGSITQTFAIYDLLKSLDVKIITVAIGRCCSMATMLFSLGEKRYISENSMYLLHQGRCSFGKGMEYPSGELREMIEEVDDMEAKIKKAITSTCKNDISEYLNNIFSTKNDVKIFPDELIEKGLATHRFEKWTDVIR